VKDRSGVYYPAFGIIHEDCGESVAPADGPFTLALNIPKGKEFCVLVERPLLTVNPDFTMTYTDADGRTRNRGKETGSSGAAGHSIRQSLSYGSFFEPQDRSSSERFVSSDRGPRLQILGRFGT
jgi:hypothetical protein